MFYSVKSVREHESNTWCIPEDVCQSKNNDQERKRKDVMQLEHVHDLHRSSWLLQFVKVLPNQILQDEVVISKFYQAQTKRNQLLLIQLTNTGLVILDLRKLEHLERYRESWKVTQEQIKKSIQTFEINFALM